jgi:PAS domain S-box-containing protein
MRGLSAPKTAARSMISARRDRCHGHQLERVVGVKGEAERYRGCCRVAARDNASARRIAARNAGREFYTSVSRMRDEARSNPYQQIFDIAQEGIWTIDADDRVRLANTRMCDMLGYSIDELIGRNVFEFVDERDREAVRDALARRRSGLTDQYDLRLRRKDGVVIWTTVSACPIMEGDRYAGALCMTSDITARKQAEEDLRASQERFTLLAKATKDVIYEWDLATNAIWYSEGMREVYGYAQHGGTLDWWLERIHPEDFDRIRAVATEARAGNSSASEYRFRRADGTYADVYGRGFVFRDAEGRAIRMIGAMMDLTEQNATRAAMITSQRRLQALFDNTLDAILLVNQRGYIIDANPSAEAILGFPIAELEQMHYMRLVPPSLESEAQQLWQHLRETGRQSTEFSLRRKDGKTIDIEYRAVADIQPGVHLAVVRDITDRKRSEIAFAEHQRHLEVLTRQVVQTQEDERARIARELHDEIGQVLTAVNLGLDAVQRIADCGPGALKQVDETRSAVALAVQQIRDLSLGLRPLILDDLGLVPTLRWYLANQARKTGLKISFSGSLPDNHLSPEIETACFRIVQEAVTNIIRHARAQNVWVEFQEMPGHRVCLTVKDDGRGFDPSLALARWAGNSRLGLAGMQERVRLLGGKIDIQSRDGQGTQINVSFQTDRVVATTI